MNNIAVTRTEESTPYAHTVTHEFGDRFATNIVSRFNENDELVTFELIDNSADGEYGEAYCSLRDIPRHQLESMAHAILRELGIE